MSAGSDAVFVAPFLDLTEVVLRQQIALDVVEVVAEFARFRADLVKQGGEGFDEVVSLFRLERCGKFVAPLDHGDAFGGAAGPVLGAAELGLVGEEEIDVGQLLAQLGSVTGMGQFDEAGNGTAVQDVDVPTGNIVAPPRIGLEPFKEAH